MKTIKINAGLILAAIILLLGVSSSAQVDEKTRVHLKVLKNDEVTMDTTFFIEKGNDSDQLKKIIHDIAGIDSDIMMGVDKQDDYHLSYTKKLRDTADVSTWTVYTSEDEGAIDIEIEEDGNYVMIKRKVEGEKGEHVSAHAYAKADKIWIDKDHEGEYYIVISGEKPGKEGEYKKAVKVMKSKDGNVIILEGDSIYKIHDKIHIKMDDQDHKMIFIEENEEGEKARVIVKKGDEDIEWVGKDGEKVDIMVSKSDDGTVLESKKIKVMKVSEGEEGDIEITIEIVEGKEKEAKKSGEKKEEKEKKKIKETKSAK